MNTPPHTKKSTKNPQKPHLDHLTSAIALLDSDRVTRGGEHGGVVVLVEDVDDDVDAAGLGVWHPNLGDDGSEGNLLGRLVVEVIDVEGDKALLADGE